MNTRRGGKCRFPRKRRAKGNMAVSRGFAKASGTVSRPPPPSPVRLRTPALHCKRAAQNKKRILQPPLPFRNANPCFEIPAENPREARAKNGGQSYAKRRVSIHLSVAFRNIRSATTGGIQADGNTAPFGANRRRAGSKSANNNPLSVPNPLSDSRPKPIRAGAEYAKSPAYKSYAAARLQPSLKHSRRFSASPPHPPYGRQSKRRCKRFATVPNILPENPPNWHFQNLASFSQIKF